MKSIYKILATLSLFAVVSCSTSKNAGGTQSENPKKSEIETVANSNRDGSSFEKAILVNNIQEEYAYVRKVCPDCQMQGQALVHHNNKPYDILKSKKANGEEVSYYFDISSFFGKY